MVIAFSNHKGGTGKTTSVVNIGTLLSNKGYSVLLVDLDPQGNLTFSSGISDIENNIADVLRGAANLDDIFYGDEKLGLLPANFDLNNVDTEIENLPNSNAILKDKLAELNFDFVLIDCPPAISIYTINALNAADYVIIPMLMEVLSLQGLNNMISIVEEVKNSSNPKLEILGVLGVKVDERRQLTNEILEHINNNVKVNVFNNRVRANVKAAEAPSFGVGVVEYAPKSNSAKDYISVVNELLKMLNIHKPVKK